MFARANKCGRMAVGLLAISVAMFGVNLGAAGNGGFTVVWSAPLFGNDAAVYVISLTCTSGYTCGTANIEVDWDDGSAIDSHVGAVPQFEVEFEHEYEEGLYHAVVSADDNFGNWWSQTRDFDVD